MSLDASDLLAIRSIVREETEPLAKRMEALENDVKEIYFMIAKIHVSLEGYGFVIET